MKDVPEITQQQGFHKNTYKFQNFTDYSHKRCSNCSSPTMTDPIILFIKLFFTLLSYSVVIL